MRYSSRFFLYAPFVLLLALGGAATAWWYDASSAFNEKLGSSNGHEILPGIRFSYATKSISGVPFNIDAVLGGTTLEIATRTGPLTWRSERFAIHALTYGPEHQIFEAAGKQTLSWTDSERRAHVFSFVPGSLRASAVSANGVLVRFDLDCVGLNAEESSAGRIQFHVRRAPQADTFDVILDGDAIRLGAGLRTGLGDNVKSIELEGSVTAASAWQPLLAARADWQTAAEQWRRHDGRLVIRRFSLASERLEAVAEGSLSLDANHRPQGALDIAFSGSVAARTDAKLAAAIGQLSSMLPRDTAGRLLLRIGLRDGSIGIGPPNGNVWLNTGGIDPLY